MKGHRIPRARTRREMLASCANGFGALAFGALFGRTAAGRTAACGGGRLAAPHHPAKAERVIFLYMDGAPSQVDTFDPKPRLDREHGQPIGMAIPKTQFDDVGTVLQSPWRFAQHGESGLWISELFPELAKQADKLCVVRSMTSKFPEHTNANYFVHTGHGLAGRPSFGSWLSYGLGSECDDLPGFVVLNGGLIPPGGLDCFHSGFLPASFQGSVFRPGAMPIANVAPPEGARDAQGAKLALLDELDRAHLEANGSDDALESAIANYELAFRMQRAVPELADLGGESELTKKLYGMDSGHEPTRTYGTLCLLARRLVERGVRFIELTVPSCGHDRWDQHSNLEAGHAANARTIDRPIAGLLHDLERRGLLETTLVLWAGEFGRTPMAQGRDGRDHNPHGFSIWLAGGGVRPGFTYGATDEYGYFAVEDTMEMYDLHATMLWLLGIDHERLTYRFSSRDMRLTDVHGRVHRALIG